jgi:integrase
MAEFPEPSMPRKHPQPFWREARQCWYVQLGTRQHRLAPDRDEAFRLYHDLMARPPQPAATAVQGPSAPVIALLDAFLEWTKRNQAPRTYRWHRENIEPFARAIPPGLTVAELKPYHVTRVMDAKDWADNTKNGFARSIQRAMKWAEKQGLIERTPIPHVEKPGRQRREDYITPEEFEAVLGWFPDERFRDVLVTCWETGCRPQELRAVEARHVDMANRRWVFRVKESKGKTQSRIIYLTDRAFEITRRLCEAHPAGKLFRNADGEPWTKYAINCRFHRKAKRFGKKYCLYTLRHSFATRMLLAGVDAIIVSMWLGHKDVSTLAKVYQHLQQRPEFLHAKLREANDNQPKPERAAANG